MPICLTGGRGHHPRRRLPASGLRFRAGAGWRAVDAGQLCWSAARGCIRYLWLSVPPGTHTSAGTPGCNLENFKQNFACNTQGICVQSVHPFRSADQHCGSCVRDDGAFYSASAAHGRRLLHSERHFCQCETKFRFRRQLLREQSCKRHADQVCGCGPRSRWSPRPCCGASHSCCVQVCG